MLGNTPDKETFAQLASELVEVLDGIYTAKRPIPDTCQTLPDIPAIGGGAAALPELWQTIVDGSTNLASPYMSGHMDTAPHPYGVLTQTLVSALNNNMLFRELSPIASDIEENLITLFGERLGLSTDWGGTWASGGSIANLTALFAAVGGYSDTSRRDLVHMLLPASGHASLKKAAAILGIPPTQIHYLQCDDAGRIDVDVLKQSLSALPKDARPVVVSVLGTTIHGSVDRINDIATLCQQYGAWHHVDAIYSGALMFSTTHRHFLKGLDRADSIVLGPQKWMYVPRVSAVVMIKGRDHFDETLGIAMPYSISGESHRGFWGIQGSRPADAVVLWALLQTLGMDAMGEMVDRSIALTQEFHTLLNGTRYFTPTHTPDLNLQTIRPTTGHNVMDIQSKLHEHGGLWASVSDWNGERLLRTVLLSPKLTPNHLAEFCTSLDNALQFD